MIITRVNDCRMRLDKWARDVRGKEYMWGATDCGSLVREALSLLFNRRVGGAHHWHDPASALRTLKHFGGSIEAYMQRLGAHVTTRRFMSTGAIAIVPVTADDTHFDAALVYVEPILVGSSEETGVVWTEKTSYPDNMLVYQLWEVDEELLHG